MENEIAIFAAVGTAVGGIAAALSVLYAARAEKNRNERDLVEILKIVAVKARTSANKVDRLINWPLFLQVGEIFAHKLIENIGVTTDKDNFRAAIEERSILIKLSRFQALSYEESHLFQQVTIEIDQLEVASVELAQRFPVSGHVVEMCTRIMANTIRMYSRAGDIYEKILEDDSKESYWETVRGSDTASLAHSFATLVSDAPMTSLNSTTQVMIDDAREILEYVTSNLTEKSFEELISLEKFEKARRAAADSTDTITGDIKVCLDILRPYFEQDSWDKIFAAYTRLEARFS